MVGTDPHQKHLVENLVADRADALGMGLEKASP
jgi:hypothetical protein